MSVVVPARNEAGNIAQIFDRVPQMGAGTELVFVEGNSTDDTYAAIEREIAAHPGCRARVVPPDRQGQGRRRAPGLRPGRRRRADDPGRGPDGSAGGSAALLRSVALGQGRVRQRRAPGVPDGRRGHAVLQLPGRTSFSAWRSPGCWGRASRTRCAAPRCWAVRTTR